MVRLSHGPSVALDGHRHYGALHLSGLHTTSAQFFGLADEITSTFGRQMRAAILHITTLGDRDEVARSSLHLFVLVDRLLTEIEVSTRRLHCDGKFPGDKLIDVIITTSVIENGGCS